MTATESQRLDADDLDAAEWLATNSRTDIPSDVRALIELLVAEVRMSWAERDEEAEVNASWSTRYHVVLGQREEARRAVEALGQWIRAPRAELGEPVAWRRRVSDADGELCELSWSYSHERPDPLPLTGGRTWEVEPLYSATAHEGQG